MSNEAHINNEYRNRILGDGLSRNKQYTWCFQKFKKGTSNPPGSNDEKNARSWSCRAPETSNIKKIYKYNFNASQLVAVQACNKSYISLRDTQSYFAELLEKYADELDIKDMIEIAKQIGAD
jgi:hypothetical protein